MELRMEVKRAEMELKERAKELKEKVKKVDRGGWSCIIVHD